MLLAAEPGRDAAMVGGEVEVQAPAISEEGAGRGDLVVLVRPWVAVGGRVPGTQGGGGKVDDDLEDEEKAKGWLGGELVRRRQADAAGHRFLAEAAALLGR